MNQIIGVSPEARIKSIEINFDTVFTAQFNEWIGEHLAGNLHLRVFICLSLTLVK